MSAGPYLFTKDVVSSATRGGGQFIIEQPLSSTVVLAADWYTGGHTAGYLTPGVIWKPHRKITLYTAYSVGNTNLEDGNHFFLIELGVNLN